MSGKVTLGLASHWPCITDLWIIHLCAERPSKRDEHPAYAPLAGLFGFTFFTCIAWLCGAGFHVVAEKSFRAFRTER